MKKLLLSSIIVLGVCGIASAQTDARSAKEKQIAAASTSAAAPTPQKAAIMPVNDVVAQPAKTAADKQAAATAPARTSKIKPAQAAAAPSTVNDAGEIVPSDVKAAEAKPTDVNQKKNKQ